MSASTSADRAEPNLTPYRCRPNSIALDEMNPPLKKLQGRALDWAKKSPKEVDRQVAYNLAINNPDFGAITFLATAAIGLLSDLRPTNAESAKGGWPSRQVLDLVQARETGAVMDNRHPLAREQAVARGQRQSGRTGSMSLGFSFLVTGSLPCRI